MRNRTRENSASRARLSVVIFSLLLVALVAGFLALGLASSRSVRQANQLVVSRIADAADLRLSATVIAFQQLVDTSDSLRQFYADRTDDPWRAWEAHDSLRSFVAGDDLVHSMYLVRLSDGSVIHDEYSFTLETFPDIEFVEQMLAARVIAPQWERQRLLGPLYREGGPTWTVPSVQGYPNPRVYGGEGIIVLNFDLSALSALLRSQLPTGASAIRVVDRMGSEVAVFGELNDDRTPGVYAATSELTGWRFAVSFASAGLLRFVSGATTIWGVYAVVMSIWALAGIVLFSRIVHRQHLAVSQITSMIRRSVADDLRFPESHSDTTGSLDEGETLERLVQGVLQQLAATRSLEAEQMRLRRRVLVEDLLLRPDEPAEEQVVAIAEEAGLDPEVHSFIVTIVELNTTMPVAAETAMSGVAIWHGTIERLLVAALSDQSRLAVGYWSGTHTISVLCLHYGAGAGRPDTVQRTLSRIQAELRHDFHTSFVAAISDPRSSWADVPAAGREARRVLEYRHLLGPGSISSPRDLHAYRVGVQERHLSATAEFATVFLRSDDQWHRVAEEFFDSVARDIPVRSEQVPVVRHALYAIYDGLLELSTDYRERYYEIVIREFHEVVHSATSENLSSRTIRLLVKYQRAMQELDSRDRRSDVARDIVEEVRNRLTDSDLSLKGLASDFETSISTVSRLFQDVEGVGFAAYLSRERMAVAKRLLSRTDADIADVCTSVGYTNYAAFARAFKREVGISPGHYRARAAESASFRT